MSAARTEELRARLAAVQDRIEAACTAAGRRRDELSLIVVTKFFPASDVVALAELGVTQVGESRDQEASTKLEELGALAPGVRAGLAVHFIGQLQTNKAASVARYADVVHSVDRPRLVRALDKGVCAAVEQGARPAGYRLQALVQIDLEDNEHAGRGGVVPAAARELADTVAGARHLELRGVMAVAPPGLSEAGTVQAFARLREAAGAIRADHPRAEWISAGMSGDLEAAVGEGATHLRVGSAILGSRPPLR